LTVKRANGRYVMDFPARFTDPVAVPAGFAEALGARPFEVTADRFNYLALLDSAKTVRELAPDIAAIGGLGRSGVIVTAAGDANHDFVSRYFAPAKGVAEDPVTGGAHCALTPFWANKLGKTTFHAFQASKRGGEMWCRLKGERVELEGSCVFYLEGEVEI
jgi:predicted PhzF superfamily epimerase YddE/YHI9